MERIEKVVAHILNITRTEAKALLREKRISSSGRILSAGDKIEPTEDKILLDGEELSFRDKVYIMMNKPKGVISASEGRGEKTVVDILPENMRRKGLFPAGRLDKDTTGFVLITDDGEFAHNILSPKKHVEKTYVALLDKPFTDEVKLGFEQGVELSGKKCLSAEIKSLSDDNKTAQVVIRQGMYHQIKRMFMSYGIRVLELHREKIGSLELDLSLNPGECRYISENELKQICETYTNL